VWIAASFFAPQHSRAQESKPDPATTVPWVTSSSIRVSAGYKDNPLLSARTPHASGFGAAGFDFLALRVPLDQYESQLLVSADEQRYFQSGLDPSVPFSFCSKRAS